MQHRAPLVFLDGNASEHVIHKVLELCQKHHVPTYVDPTSVPKSVKFLKCLNKITYMKPNADEVVHLAQLLLGDRSVPSVAECGKVLTKAGVKNVLLTRGKDGVYLVRQDKVEHFPALPVEKIRKVTGAGDNFSGGFIFGITHGYSVHQAIQFGLRAAKSTLECETSVNPNLSVELLHKK